MLEKYVKEAHKMLREDRSEVIQMLVSRNGKKMKETDMWYLNNDVSNHMTGFKENFTKLEESVTKQVHFKMDLR